jgi:hypothetical protein
LSAKWIAGAIEDFYIEELKNKKVYQKIETSDKPSFRNKKEVDISQLD